MTSLKPKLAREIYPGSGRILILQRSAGSWGNSATAYFALRAAKVWERSLLDVLEPSTLLPGVSSKIGRALSTRGITLCRWKFAMTAAAVNPFFARRTSASVRPSSLSCCAPLKFCRSLPQSHFGGRSRRTLPVNAGSAPSKFRR